MDIPDVPVGATWRCVDLHLHTPGVTSFDLPPDVDVHRLADRERIADQYVQRLVDAGINVAAITDYQGVRLEWFRLIRDRAARAGIDIMPGAEMSIRRGGGKGVHLLLVCSPTMQPQRIAEVIRHQHGKPDLLFPDEIRCGHDDVDLRDQIHDALRDVREQLGCVVIAAHATENNGLIKVLGAQQAAELIRDGLIDGIDHCESAKEKLRSTGILSRERLDSLACTLSGDPKNLEQVGAKTLTDGRRRLTWIKLSTVSADALRLALHDPPTRLLTRPPENVHHPLILAMEVTGGFLDGLAVRFSDDLTAMIGGRGAGKSAILETLRYGLGGEPFSDQSERLSLVGHALGSGGQVRIVIERPGSQRQRYEVTRVLNQQARVKSLPTGEILDVPPLELFGPGGSPVILLQREIQAVARDDGFRRRLLDEIIGDEARLADAAVRRTGEEIRRNARNTVELERQLTRRDEYSERLNRLNADVAYYEQQGVAEKLERHSKAGADTARLNTAAGRIAEALANHADSASVTAASLAAAASALASADSEYSHLLIKLSADIEAARQRTAAAQASTTQALSNARERIAATSNA